MASIISIARNGEYKGGKVAQHKKHEKRRSGYRVTAFLTSSSMLYLYLASVISVLISKIHRRRFFRKTYFFCFFHALVIVGPSLASPASLKRAIRYLATVSLDDNIVIVRVELLTLNTVRIRA